MPEETTAAQTQVPAAETETETDLHEAGEKKPSGTGENPTGGEQTGGGQEKLDGQQPEKKPEGEEPKGKQEPAEGKEKQTQEDPYGDFNMPQGVQMAPEPMKQFKTLAQELNLSKEAAQKLIDIQTGMVQKQMDDYKAIQQGWKAQTQKEFGAKLDDALAKAAKFMDAFGGAELRQAIDELGIGSHPALVRAFAKAGDEISEDKAVLGKEAKEEKSMAHRMFPQFDK